MRIQVQEGFITNSSSTTYTTVVFNCSKKEVAIWAENVANHLPEDLIHKDLFKQTLEEIERLGSYDFSDFLTSLELDRSELTEWESTTYDLMCQDGYSCDDNPVYLSNFVRQQDDKYICKDMPSKIAKFYAKIVQALYAESANYLITNRYSVSNKTCKNTGATYIFSTNTIYDGGYDEKRSLYMLIPVIVYARERKLPTSNTRESS